MYINGKFIVQSIWFRRNDNRTLLENSRIEQFVQFTDVSSLSRTSIAAEDDKIPSNCDRNRSVQSDRCEYFAHFPSGSARSKIRLYTTVFAAQWRRWISNNWNTNKLRTNFIRDPFWLQPVVWQPGMPMMKPMCGSWAVCTRVTSWSIMHRKWIKTASSIRLHDGQRELCRITYQNRFVSA